MKLELILLLNFDIPLQLNVVDLRYFKQKILLYQIIKVSKAGFIENWSPWQKFNFLEIILKSSILKISALTCIGILDRSTGI